jgi:hypothetical protein
VKSRIIQRALIKREGKKKIFAFCKINAQQLTPAESDIFQSGIVQFDHTETTIFKMTIKKIAVGQVTFVEVAVDEGTGIKFDIRQILIGIINFCKGRILLKCFFHYGYHI